jgi:hypothetical protein
MPKKFLIFNLDFNFIIIVSIIVVIVIIAVGIALSGDGGDGNGNPNVGEDGKRWEDLYKFKEFLYNNYTVMEKANSDTSILDKVPDQEDAVWIIVGVEKEFTSEEASAVRSFVKAGGNLILASDTTHANKISKPFAVEFSEHRIIETDPILWDGSDLFVSFYPYIGGSNYRIVTNGPLGLLIEENVTTIDMHTIASSSQYHGEFSILDTNDNGGADATDMFGPIPAIIELRYGDGKMIFIGDSGLFTDDLWDRETAQATYQNDKFCEALLKYTVSPQGTVIYDFSKHEKYTSGHLLIPT